MKLVLKIGLTLCLLTALLTVGVFVAAWTADSTRRLHAEDRQRVEAMCARAREQARAEAKEDFERHAHHCMCCACKPPCCCVLRVAPTPEPPKCPPCKRACPRGPCGR